MAKAKHYTQWSSMNGTFMPVGNTVPNIQPGHYVIGAGDHGLFFAPVAAREDKLFEFSDSASLAVLEAVSDFWAREETFKRYGLPFKRGILLYGPPGSGKTCTMELVSRDVVKRGGIVLNFPLDIPINFFSAAYRSLRDIQPDTPIVVLMEDFEDLARHGGSQLLNLLDGVEQLHKVVFLASTNYPEKLPPRLINRPSRFDVRIKVGAPRAHMRRMYLESLLLEGDDLDVLAYVQATKGLSLAHLKELFVSTHILGGDFDTAVARLKSMDSRMPSSEDDEEGDDEQTFAEWEQELLNRIPGPPQAAAGQYL